MSTLCIDWDQTLVDTASQQWLPGAEDALRLLLGQGHKIIVHSARASYQEGRDMIEQKLRSFHLDHPSLTVEQKPLADVYVDNLAVRFAGDWTETLADIGAGSSPKPVVKPHTFQTGYASVPLLDAVGKPVPRLTFATRRA
jgi:phosphoglycolate phosphatase-like HAD superfamily hydrolase